MVSWPGRTGEAPTASVGGESEAFVAGTYAQYADACDLPVPPWAWVNMLAHSGEEQLELIAAYGLDSLGQPGKPLASPAAVKRLACKLLGEMARTGTPLSAMQVNTLRPLEARMIDDEHSWALTVDQVTSLVLATLHGHPSSRF